MDSLSLKIRELPSTRSQYQKGRTVLTWLNIMYYNKIFDFYYFLSLFHVQEKCLNKVGSREGRKVVGMQVKLLCCNCKFY